MPVLLAAYKHFFNSGSTRCTFKCRKRASLAAAVLQFELTTKPSIRAMLELQADCHLKRFRIKSEFSAYCLCDVEYFPAFCVQGQ